MERSLARCCLCFCLSFALAVLGFYGALACPGEGQVAEVIICGSHGAETIYLDAAGNQVPAPASKTCGECVACHPVQTARASEAPPPASAPLSQASRILPRPANLHVLAPVHTWPAVRGPPTLV